MMNNLVEIVANYLFGWTVITIGLSWLVALSYPLFSRAVAACSIEYASFLTLIFGLLPPLAASAALVLLSVPKFAFSFIANHCHSTSCLPHTLYMTTDTLLGVAAVVFVITLLMLVLVFMLAQLLNGLRQLRVLESVSETRSDLFRLMESQTPVAWCAGLLNPRIYLSRGLIDVLTPGQVKLILAHELTHARRRDNLRKWLVYWATLAWPSRVKDRIREELFNYNEQACDLAAVKSNAAPLCNDEFIKILSVYHAGATGGDTTVDEDYSKKRLGLLEQAIQLEQSQSVIFTVVSAAIIFIVWLAAVVIALHFGHPLLEWLSR